MAFDDTVEHSQRPPDDWSATDLAHAGVKSALNLIPGLGELFALILMAPLAKRRDNWFQDLASRLGRLEEQVAGFSVSALVDDAAFVSVAFQATAAAIKTHHAVKHEALRNAVLNAAIGSGLRVHEQETFIRLVDELTPLHLQVLRFLADPLHGLRQRGIQIPSSTMGSRARWLGSAFPELNDDQKLLALIIQELNARGLVETTQISIALTLEGSLQPLATELGYRFLDFISAPTAL